jgi:hypothetical protein
VLPTPLSKRGMGLQKYFFIVISTEAVFIIKTKQEKEVENLMPLLQIKQVKLLMKSGV